VLAKVTLVASVEVDVSVCAYVNAALIPRNVAVEEERDGNVFVPVISLVEVIVTEPVDGE
jgi:hypothetical protein